jgi:hypothetical protein
MIGSLMILFRGAVNSLLNEVYLVGGNHDFFLHE